MPNDLNRPRASKACVICHKKKIRCDLDTVNGARCSNCIKDGYEDCIPRERKRKRYSAFSPSPPRDPARKASNATPRQENAPNGTSMRRLDPSPGLPPGGLDGFHPNESVSSYEAKDPASVDVDPSTMNALLSSHPAIPIEPQLSRGPTLKRQNTSSFPPTGVSYLGRSEYIGADVPIDDEPDEPKTSITTMSERDIEVLTIQQVWDLPPRSIMETLLDSFWTRCYPWTPIVERSWVEGRARNEQSILLLQSMMLAGSRVSSASRTAEDFYKKAKTLFWMGAEKDAMLMTVSVCLLHWWNPQSPEHVSIDTSGFWLRIAVGLAYQLGLHRDAPEKRDVGLRRRLWWSIVVRDCLINAGHGRPRAVNLDLADTKVPSLEDFDGDIMAYETFTTYISISLIMGDLTACFLQNQHVIQKALPGLEDRLYRWVNTLPGRLRLYNTAPERGLRQYSFEARQMHIQYFTCLVIVNKSQLPGNAPSTASLLASSFVAGIMEELLARDEIRYLGPIFTFYLLVSGVAQLSCYKYAGLWHLAEQDLRVIFQAQEELAKRWPSAVGSLKSM